MLWYCQNEKKCIFQRHRQMSWSVSEKKTQFIVNDIRKVVKDTWYDNIIKFVEGYWRII